MKTILIPTDFSDNAGDALAYTLNFIGEQKAHIHILHVVEPMTTSPGVSMVGTDLIALQLEEARTALKVLEAFSETSLGKMGMAKVKVTTNVVVGATPPAIKEEARVIHADVIIMGTQGANHNRIEKVMGTISTGVLSDAPCPVILIPRAYQFKPIDNVIFGTNLAHDDPYELWRATELIRPNVSVVRCVHVVKDRVEKDDQALENFAKYMVEHSPAIQTIFHIELGEHIEATIAEYAEDYDAEMIIMHRSKRTLLEKLLGSSHTKRMAYKLKVPFLVLN